MKFITIESRLVGLYDWTTIGFMPSITFGDGRTFKTYKERLEKFGWSHVFGKEDIPLIPIYELPDELKVKHEYVVIDGNRRLFHSKDILECLPFVLFDKDEHVDFERWNIRLYRNGSTLSLYEDTIRKYAYFEKGASYKVPSNKPC